MFSLCSHTAVNNIHLVLYGGLHVQQALALVAADEAYSEVLQLESEPRVEGQDDEQPQVLQAAAPNPVYMYSQGGYDCIPVAPDGSCLFSSLRRIISAPFEYRNIHLRRQLLVMLANHKEFFNLLKEHIQGTYGFPRLSEEEYRQKYDDGLLTDQEVQDHNCPGPFSFHSYLSALLNPEMWGDEQVLCLCSMMWQIGLTVLSAETFTQIRFRHRSSLVKADGVLVMCLGQHYVPACKYSSFVPLVRSPFQVIMFMFIAFECGRTVPHHGRTVVFCGRMDVTVPPN